MMKPSVLMTGATGFVGVHLLRNLLSDGMQVHAVVRGKSDPSRWPNHRNLHSHGYDGSIDSLMATMHSARPSVVIHLASRYVAEHATPDIESLLSSNIVFGTQLAEAMTRSGCRTLINAGTSWQHFQNASYSPVNLYAATKQAMQDLLAYYSDAHGLRVVTLKLYDTYGPGDWRPKLFALLRLAETADPPLAMSPGEQKIDLVHIDDVVRAFRYAMDWVETSDVQSCDFAVTSGHPRTLREIVRVYEQVINVRLRIAWGARPYRHREVMDPWQNGHTVPGWSPSISLIEGIQSLRCCQRAAA